MKKFFLKSLVGLFSLTFFFAANHVPESELNSAVAIVTKVVNSVTFKSGSGAWGDLKVGTALKSSDEIKTGDKSLVLVKFTDNSVVTVRENSVVKIYSEKAGNNVNKNTHVDAGQVVFDVKKQDGGDFKVTTPTLVASIRGTEFFINASPEFTLFVLLSGYVDLQALLGAQQAAALSGGNFVNVGPDGQIIPEPNNQSVLNQVNTNKKTNLKRIILQSTAGDIVIEYFVD